MFSRFARPLWRRFFTPRKLLTTTALLAYSIFKTHTLLDSAPEQPEVAALSDFPVEEGGESPKQINEYIKKLQFLDVCEGKELLEGERKVLSVKNHEGKDRQIIIIRLKGKLFAILGSCPHREPFDVEDVNYSLQNAVFFNDKLFCPHHGCVFDIKSGSIEHGPALYNLPIFFSEEKEGKVRLIYPAAIPSSVSPNMAERDVEDLRKVLILGGDDAATIGCINSLRQFGYQGQLTVVKENTFHYPYKKEYLHKKLLNLHLNDKPVEQIKEEVIKASQKSGKNDKKNDKNKKNDKKDKNDKDAKPATPAVPKKTEKQIEDFIHAQLEEKVYKKLSYYRDEWYEYYGVDFVFNEESYRIINKQYYPYVTFSDGTKLEFDGLLVATGVVQRIPMHESITVDTERDLQIRLAENVFCPVRSKEQHEKLVQFLNKNVIKSLLVMGYNIESLQFVEALKTEFPDIKVHVIDKERDSPISEFIGPDLEKNIVKEYTSRGVDFYVKIQEELLFSNKFSFKNKGKRILDLKKVKQNKKEVDSKYQYNDSVTVRLSDELRLKADGVVIFPQLYAGNTEWVKNGKYTDFDFFHDGRISADTFGRTDNIRVFSAGSGSCNEYFLLNKRLVSSNPIVSYEQGFNVGQNMQALRIPFSYIPFEYFTFWGKKLLYVGTKEFYDSMMIVGSIEDWDFITIYALGSKVKGVSASPSRARQLNVLREAFRVNCMPMFEELINGYWSFQNLEKLVKEINKSGCYRDIIFQNRQNIHKKDLIWMERTPDAGFENDRPVLSEEYPSVQVGQNGVLKEL